MMPFKLDKKWVVLLTAVAVGGLAAWWANQYIRGRMEDIEARSKSGQTVQVVVANADLTKGARVTAANVAVREVPENFAQSNAVRPEQFERVENRILAYGLNRGEMVMWSHLEGQRPGILSERLLPGRRAMSVAVDEINSISGLLEPGDTIDLVVTVDQDGQKVVLPVLQGVTVLAAGGRVSEPVDGMSRAFSTITLDTSAEQARKVIVARDLGKVTALLRNRSDTGRVASPRPDLAAALGLEEGAGPRFAPVPVIYGGTRLPSTMPRLAGSFNPRAQVSWQTGGLPPGATEPANAAPIH